MIEEIRLNNWKRFRGEHSQALGPGVHAVVARHVQDDERSNWLGKSSVLEAIPFALFGWHSATTEDEWIAEGEAVGGVVLRLSGGVVVRRERRRGKATKLVVEKPGGFVAEGEAAQSVVDDLVGMGERDFFAACFFRQKQMSRIVIARPAERMETVGAWLDLGGLVRCEATARDRLGAASKRLDEIERKVTAVEAEVATLAAEPSDVADAETRVAVVEDAAEAARVRAEALGVARQDVRDAARFEGIVAEGKALVAALGGVPATPLAEAGARASEAGQAAKLAAGEVRRLAVLAAGGFDGQCPVAAIGCPATAEINRRRGEHAENLALARRTEVRARDASGAAQEALREAEQAAKGVARLEALRDAARALKPAADRRAGASPIPDGDAGLGEAQRSLGAANHALERAVRVGAQLEAARAALVRLRQERVEVEGKRDAARRAAELFGRGGAQRQVAEVALAEIAGGANDLLGQSGVDLEVEVTWAREGQGLATHCDACGAPFPSSVKVRACERCSAARGPKMVERLDVELSDRSGAAEDLAGIAVQLSASAWLRRQRGAAWDVACLDEPFGALDARHRRALALHLSTMLGGRFGYAQSFVVAHERSIMDALPNRIEIIGDESGSRFAEPERVVAVEVPPIVVPKKKRRSSRGVPVETGGSGGA